MSIIDGEITVDDEHITELARKIKNMEDADGSLMYQLYNAYKEYVYNNCDESVIKEAKEELQEELNEEKKDLFEKMREMHFILLQIEKDIIKRKQEKGD